MSDPDNTRLRRARESFSELCSALAVVFGLVTLSGWAFHIQALKSLVPAQVAVKANTGACFVLIGVALWLVRRRGMSEDLRRKLPASILAFMASVVGLLSFLEAWKGWDFGIDQVLFHAGPEDLPGSVRPGLMSPITGIGFWLLGIAVLLLNSHRRWAHCLLQVLAGVVATASVFGILDYVLEPARSHTHIAPTTALVLFLFSFAVILSRADYGLGALASSATSGGELVRRLLPACVLVPVLIGWLRWRGQVGGLFTDWSGVAVMAVTTVILLAAITIRTALIIDRADAERQAAQESTRRLAAIVTSSNHAIISKTLDGLVSNWNRGAEAIYGYSAADMVGRSIDITIPPDRLDEFHAIMQRVVRGETVEQYETVRICKNGEPVDVSISVSGLKDERGNVVGACTIAHDITDRKRADAELRRASLYARSLLEASLDPLVTISRDGKITDVNEATEKATGCTRDSLIGSDFSNYFTEPEKASHGYRRVFAEGFVRDYPLAIRHTSGKVMEVLYNANLFKDENGEIEGVFAAARDVTERRQAELALQTERQRFRDVLDNLPVYVVLLTRDYHVALDNSVFRERFGESHGKRCYEFLFGRNEPCEICETYNVLKTGKPHQWKWTGPDGRHYDIFDFPFSDTDGSPLILEMGMDITEKKRAEEEVVRLNRELEQRVVQRTAELQAANKELEAFTYSVSHDLRAPLRHISGFSKIVREEFGPQLPAEAQCHLQKIEDGTRRMGMLVDDLLNLARVGRRDITLQVTGLKSLVQEVITSLVPEIGDRQVEWKVGELPYVECDAALMKQVFQNLLANAVKFTMPRAKAVIEIGQTEKDGIPVVYVRDNGVGFSMKYVDKLFGVFQRLHRSEEFEGTGVGLATVQRIIQKHGGRIWAEADLDKGATFYFTIGETEKRDSEAKAAVSGVNL